MSKELLLAAINSFKKAKSPGLDGWTTEFFADFFEVLSEDMLRVVKEVRLSGRMSWSYNSTFIALIPKVDYPTSFDKLQPISLCNCLYKIIAEVIDVKLKWVGVIP